MGIFDGFLNMMRLGPDDDDDFYDEGYEDEVEEKPKEKVVVSPEIQRTRRSRLVLKLVNVAILIGCTVILYLIGKQIYFLFF